MSKTSSPSKWRKTALTPVDGQGPLLFQRARLGPLDRVGPALKPVKAAFPTRYRE
jgi:hypothetical protein